MSKRKRRGRGEGGIEELPSGKFRATVRLGINPKTGKYDRVRKVFATKKAALLWQRAQMNALERGTLARSGRLTVGEWLDSWLCNIKPSVANHTYLPYEQHVRLHLKPQIGALRLDQLHSPEVRKMYAALLKAGVSSSMVRKTGVTLGVALQQAVQDGLLGVNAARGVAKPTVDRDEIQPFTPEDLTKFLEAARTDRLYPLYITWVDSGAREGELFGLRWQDVDGEGNAIRIVKTLEEVRGTLDLKDVKTAKSRRRIALNPDTMAALNTLRQQALDAGFYGLDRPVFTDTQGGWLRKSNVQRRSFNRIIANAGIAAHRPYDLRHTCATLLLVAGVDAKIVADRLGHSTTRLTMDTYSHVLPGMQKSATEKLRAVLQAIHSPAAS